MSGTYPSDPPFNAINFKSEFGTVIAEMISLKTDARQVGDHRWSFTAQHRNLTRAEWAPIAGFLMQQRGGAETFQIVIPNLSDNTGTAGSAAVGGGGAAAIGAESVNVVVIGTIAAGSFIKFANHSKVYMTTAERDGNGAMTFSPPLIAAVANFEAITLENVPFTVRERRPAQAFQHPQFDVFTFEIDLIEAP